MTDLEMAAKFREAAAIIERNGWWAGGYVRRPGAKCALNALNDAVATNGLECLMLAARAQARVGADWLPDWNDAPGRTAKDVITLFLDLAHDLELRHQITAGTIESPISPPPAVLSNLKEAVSVG